MTKLSIGQAWTETVATAKREGRSIVPVALAFAVIPVTLFMLAVPIPPSQGRDPGIWIWFYPLMLLAGLIGQMAITRMAIGPAASVGEAIRHALGRFLPVLGAGLIFGIPAAAILVPIAMPMLANPTNPPPIAALLLLVVSVVL